MPMLDVVTLEIDVEKRTNRMKERAIAARETAKKARKAGNMKKWDKFNAIARVWEMAVNEMEDLIPEF